MKTYHSGIDYFTSDADKPLTGLKCRACGALLVREKLTGPRSWAGAMAGLKSEHYSYTCPNTRIELHEDIVELLVKQDDLVAEIEEKRELLREKKGSQG